MGLGTRTWHGFDYWDNTRCPSPAQCQELVLELRLAVPTNALWQSSCCPVPVTAACGLFPIGFSCLEMQEPKGPLSHILVVVVWPYLLASMAWPCLGAVGIERRCGPCVLHPWSHEHCTGFLLHPSGKHSPSRGPQSHWGHWPTPPFLEVASKRSCLLLGALFCVGLGPVGLIPLPLQDAWRSPVVLGSALLETRLFIMAGWQQHDVPCVLSYSWVWCPQAQPVHSCLSFPLNALLNPAVGWASV